MPENLLEQIQAALDLAKQADLEQGVQWMNEEAVENFAHDYPQINQVINNILEMDNESKD